MDMSRWIVTQELAVLSETVPKMQELLHWRKKRDVGIEFSVDEE